MNPLRPQGPAVPKGDDPASAYALLTPETPPCGLTLPKLPGHNWTHSETITLEEYRRQEVSGDVVTEVELQGTRRPRP